MKRDWRIEAFRCLMMFLVVLNHAAEQGGYADGHRWLGNIARICVPGFVFISGYFGLIFSWPHLKKLLGICLYCAVITGLANLSTGKTLNWHFIHQCYGEIQGAWFIWCYLALMCVTPLINPLFENSSSFKSCVPVLVLCFFGSYCASTVPVIKHYLPFVNGFGALSLLTFIGIYIIGRLCRVYSIGEKLTLQIYIIGFLICVPMVMVGFHHYCSPFNIGIVILLFSLFTKISYMGKKLEMFFIYLGPSMLSVYLLHDSNVGLSILRSWEREYINTGGYYLVVFIITIVLFIGSLILDLPRRLLFDRIKK